MKKVLSFILAVILFFSILPALPEGTFIHAATSGSCGDNLTWTLDGTALTISGTGEMWDYESFATGVMSAPWGESITSVTIGNGVTSIGEYAFHLCCGLTSIVIPDSVTSIDEWAFHGCSGLTSITIPDSVTSIGWFAFSDCTGLTSITIPDSVTSIDEWAFHGCYKLVEVINKSKLYISKGSEGNGYIGYYALEVHNGVSKVVNKDGCVFYTYNDKNYLLGYSGDKTELSLPENYNGESYEMYDYAFAYCSNLTSITIPDSVTIISDYAFYDCSGLTSVTIGNGVTSIGEYAFHLCCGLTSIVIPDSVTSIDEWAFHGCSGLTSITVVSGNTKYHSAGNCLIETETKTLVLGCKNSVIPNDGSVTSIGDYAFRGCSGLTSVTIPDSVTSIGDGAFDYCSGLTSITIGNGVTSIGSYAFYDCSGLTSVTIGNGVTSIGEYAFYLCRGLTSVTIGNSVTSIGRGSFYYCSGLTSITVVSGNTKYHSAGNCLIETETKTLILGCGNSVIPDDDSVTSIGNYAFYGCSGPTSITIPDSVTIISDYAFCACYGLTSVTIGNGVTSIGDYAFASCSGLTSIVIPDSVTSIGDSAFMYCSGLTIYGVPGSAAETYAKEHSIEFKEIKTAVIGDADGNGVVDTADATAILRYIINVETIIEANSDCNGDGEIDTADATAILRYIIREYTFPE